MKVLLFGGLLLGVLASVTTGMFVMSDAVLKERDRINLISLDWYLEIDRACYKIYSNFRDVANSSYAAYAPPYTALLGAFTALNTSLKINATANAMPTNLSSFFGFLNSSLSHFVSEGTMSTMGYYAMMMTSTPGFLAPPTANLRKSIENELTELLINVTTKGPLMYMTPGIRFKSEACALNILSKFVSLYKPHVDFMMKEAEKRIMLFPEIRKNATNLVTSTLDQLKTLTDKLNACNKITAKTAKLTCAQQVDTFYSSNSEAASKVTTAVHKLSFELSDIIGFKIAQLQVMETYPMFSINFEAPEFKKKIVDLLNSC